MDLCLVLPAEKSKVILNTKRLCLGFKRSPQFAIPDEYDMKRFGYFGFYDMVNCFDEEVEGLLPV